MSYVRAMKIINLQPADRVGLMENLDHPRLMQEVIGYDPWSQPLQAYADAYRGLDIDWAIGFPRHSVRFTGDESSKTTADGTVYTEWGLSGSRWREEYLFHDIESILSFDPLANAIGEPLVTVKYNRQFVENRRGDQALVGDGSIVTNVFYTTLFQFPIMVFGWQPFLEAAASQPERFQRILEGFAAVSRRNMADWVADDPPFVLMHDDIAMERGLVFHPNWYRRRLFPLYEHILEPLKARPHIKVCFVSDGNYGDVVDDLLALGFDGLVVNGNMDLGALARRHGERIFLTGNVDTRVLTFGTPDDVRREVARSVEEARPAGGHFLHAGGDLPHNIPLDNIKAYFDSAYESQ
jgi:hypothetical protein